MVSKQELYKYCKDFVEQRIAVTQQAMQSARESANEETKSSMGDKYETHRAMMHFEQEKLSTQLAESHKLLQILSKINPELNPTKVTTGSLLRTNQGNYYISVPVGKFELKGETYYALSSNSPLGQAMTGKAKGEKFSFNQKEYKIEELL